MRIDRDRRLVITFFPSPDYQSGHIVHCPGCHPVVQFGRIFAAVVLSSVPGQSNCPLSPSLYRYSVIPLYRFHTPASVLCARLPIARKVSSICRDTIRRLFSTSSSRSVSSCTHAFISRACALPRAPLQLARKTRPHYPSAMCPHKTHALGVRIKTLSIIVGYHPTPKTRPLGRASLFR